jgi:hypothetical protein
MAKRTVGDRIRQHLQAMGTTPDRYGPTLSPPISGQSIRDAMRGRAVGYKVASALAAAIPGVTVEALTQARRAA